MGVPSQYYPAPPWQLKGRALLRLQMLPIAVVSRWIPPPLKVVQVLPGRALGALYLARYEAGSSLTYDELIVAPALVRHGGSFGMWISHIYVDNDESITGGREVWALPKQRAQFQWQAQAQGETVTVKQGNRVLCRLHAKARGRSVRAPLYAPVFSRPPGRLLNFRGVGSSRLSLGHVELDVPPESAFASFKFASGRQLFLNGLDLNMSAPGAGKRL